LTPTSERGDSAERDASAAKPAEPKEDHPVRAATNAEQERSTRVQAAASTTVSIRDFSFAPRSVTVNTGDTVTWRNTGDEPHTATGSGFDTGLLKSGQSGSATFSQAGTFSYKCQPHPFMTGTVRVVASGSSGGGGGGSSSGGGTQGATNDGGAGGTGTAGTGSTGAGAGSLPSTGLALGSVVLTGLAMIAMGTVLRRRAAWPSA
jgi:plastocyanin